MSGRTPALDESKLDRGKDIDLIQDLSLPLLAVGPVRG